MKLPLSISHQSVNDSKNMNNQLENILSNEITRINSIHIDPNIFEQLPDMNTVLGENQNINQQNMNMNNQQNMNMNNQQNMNMNDQQNMNMNNQQNMNMNNQQNIPPENYSYPKL